MGSYSIKMGFANEKVPFTIKPIIAYRKNLQKTNENQVPEFEEENREHEDIDVALFKK